MHELSVIQALCRQVEEIAQRHNATKVARIVLELGEISHWTPEQLEETFLLFRSVHPLLAETELKFRKSPAIRDETILLRDVEMEVPDGDHSQVSWVCK